MSTNKKTGIQTNRELRDVAFIFRNLFNSGSLSASEILHETGMLLPKFRRDLLQASKAISDRGAGFCEAVSSLFPEETLTVIKAGEESGTIGKVFDQLWNAAKTQEEINKLLKKLIMPAILAFVGLVISIVFFLFLIPSIYQGMSSGTSGSFQPNPVIVAALASNSFIMSNMEACLIALVVFAVSIVIAFNQQSVRDAFMNLLIKIIIKYEFLGKSYANLKFGIVSQYIQIVSAAGLPADKRIDLVTKILPVPLRSGLLAFRRDMIIKGISFAAKPDGKPKDDPRHSEIFWPPYLRLAFAQANEGDWEVPMREFGFVMIEDGKEIIQQRIASLNTGVIILVAIMICIPLMLLYMTMGQIMTMRMQGL